jgi:molybdopterin synthase catalytic subunit
MFRISDVPIDADLLSKGLINSRAGAFVCFEGRVRNHNDGSEVVSLEYEVYEGLAVKEGGRIIEEAKEKYDVLEVVCVHRQGHLAIGDIAVWIGVIAEHRGPAFSACRYVIDEIKHRLPIWKKEHYKDKEARWVNCHEGESHGIR